MIGMILHGTRIRFGTLRKSIEVLILARKLGRLVHNRWNETCVLSSVEFGGLQVTLQNMINAPPQALKKLSKMSRVILIAADASDHLGGAVVTDETGIQSELGSAFSFPPAVKHIFLKEVIAARIAIVRVLRDLHDVHVVLLEDNTAATGAISRGWSTSIMATEEISKIYKLLDKKNCQLTVRNVPSAANPADEPSRAKPLVQSKATPFMGLFHDPNQVLILPKEKKKVAAYSGSLRHVEPDDEDEIIQ